MSTGKEIVPFRQYINLQINEALGPENMWYTGEEVGHPPTPQEALRHYAEAGGAEHFAQTHISLEELRARNGECVASENKLEPKE